MASKEQMVGSRGGHRSSATKLIAHARGELQKEVKDDEMLQTISEKLAEKLTKIKILDEKILENLNPDEMTNEIESTDEKNFEIEMTLNKLKSSLGKNKVKVENLKVGGKENPIKLPKLEIKSFSGDPKEYPTFISQFSASIDASNIAEVSKFAYLKSLIRGEASRAIAGLAVTPENYKNAIKILNERFEKKHLIINAIMEEMVQLDGVKSDKNTKALRELSDKVENGIRSLDGLGVEADQYGSLLVPIIRGKLPAEVNLTLNRQVKGAGGENWEINDLQRALRDELEAREQMGAAKYDENSGVDKRKNHGGEKYHAGGRYQRHTSDTLMTDTSEKWKPHGGNRGVAFKPNAGGSGGCPFCKKEHFADKCTTLTGVNERRAYIEENRLCWICLRGGHASKNCQSTKKCWTCKGGGHNTAICRKGETKGGDEVTNVSYSNNQGQILMMTASAEAENIENGEKLDCRIVFDSASQLTYMSENFAKKLGLKTHDTGALTINTFGGQSKKINSKGVEVMLKGEEGKGHVINAVVMKEMCAPIASQKISKTELEKFEHLKGLKLADNHVDKEKGIDILLGLDNYFKFVGEGLIKGQGEGPVAVKTTFGYVLAGRVPRIVSNAHMVTNTFKIGLGEANLEKVLNKFWDVESLGIEKLENVDIKIDKSISLQGGRYMVDLPKKENHPVLNDNYNNAKKRLESLGKKFSKDPMLKDNYDKVIEEKLDRGVIEKVQIGDRGEVGQTYYMPHSAVVRNDRTTTKTRIVFDASCKGGTVSLNEILEKGVPRYTDLFSVLMKIRVHKIALFADIEKAFWQIGVREGDRDLLRFLWYGEGGELETYRFTRVCFGLNSSMALLGNVIKHHLDKYRESEPQLVSEIERSLYVDDLSLGGDNEKQAWEMFQKTNEIFERGNMPLRKWVSNSESLNQKLGERAESKSEKCEIIDDSSIAETLLGKVAENGSERRKILGVNWESERDCFNFSLGEVAKKGLESVKTKRNLLSLSASVYDPYGVLSPIVLPLKVMFQQICKSQKGWDEVLREDECGVWDKWCESGSKMDEIKMDRNFLPPKDQIRKVKLVGFSDASEEAYAAVVYLVVERMDGVVQTKFVASKARVAPIAKQTIPRLELLGALILSRLVLRIRSVLEGFVDIDESVLLSDSEVALWWICQSENEYKQYVEERVREIRKNVGTECWKHVVGKENAADLPSRGCMGTEMNAALWLEGPKWLKEGESEWPVKKIEKSGEGDSELKKKLKRVVTLNVFNETDISEVIKPERYGEFDKLLRVTAWVRRFVSSCKSGVKGGEELTADEIGEAEKIWAKHLQKSIRKGERFDKISRSLGLFEDQDGLLRCGGRVKNADIPYETKHPTLIPADHTVTEMIIRKAHQKVFHNGVGETLAQMRAKYWIVRGRQVVKGVVNKCNTCRRLEGLSYGGPQLSQLPECRVKGGKAFNCIGIDFCGPIYLTNEGEEMRKSYIALITCATTRMVHLELCGDLGAGSLMGCLRRFCARRGNPSQIISDNAKTFKSKQIKQFAAKRGIKWTFNLAKAPWWGGMFERLIRSTKRCLRKSLKQDRLSYENMYTVMTEVEAVLNNRPLTYLYPDSTDILTPFHLYQGTRLLDPPDPRGEGLFELGGDEAREEVVKKDGVIGRFWKIWYREYLVNLREISIKRGRVGEEPKVGDVVVVHEDNKKRLLWRLGRVTELLKGRDSVIRGAKVKVAERGKRTTQIERPIQKLFPLEMGQMEKRVQREEVDEITDQEGEIDGENQNTIFEDIGELAETGVGNIGENVRKKYPLRSGRGGS